jgi:hypothetical protein
LAFRQVYVSHLIACYWKFILSDYIQVLCQYRLCKADHAYLINSLSPPGVLVIQPRGGFNRKHSF